MQSPEDNLNRPYPSQKTLYSEAEAARYRQSSGQYFQ